jgi:hypothetical protein
LRLGSTSARRRGRTGRDPHHLPPPPRPPRRPVPCRRRAHHWRNRRGPGRRGRRLPWLRRVGTAPELLLDGSRASLCWLLQRPHEGIAAIGQAVSRHRGGGPRHGLGGGRPRGLGSCAHPGAEFTLCESTLCEGLMGGISGGAEFEARTPAPACELLPAVAVTAAANCWSSCASSACMSASTAANPCFFRLHFFTTNPRPPKNGRITAVTAMCTNM